MSTEKELESGDIAQIETVNESQEDGETHKTIRRIVWKIDKRLIPILMALYIFSFLDRSNIGNAKIAGMTEDLNLRGNQYNIALTVFFFPYALFEVPSNVILKIMRPSRWIAIMVLAWGTVMTLQGIVKDYSGLIATRVFLGTAESGFFPAASYLLSIWYSRFEVQTKMSIFYSSACIASAFSGLLAFAIEKMSGVGGLGGWRWIFILEGIATVVVGTSLALCLPDSPETARFLTENERSILTQRLDREYGRSGDGHERHSFQWKYLRSCITDIKLYLAVIIYWGNSICLYGFNYTVPTIIKALGYSSANAQLLTVPLYMFGMITTITLSIWYDRAKTRWPFIVGPYLFSLLGFVGLLAIPHPSYPGLTYGLLFLIPGGGYPPLLTCLAWLSNNTPEDWKRAIALAIVIGMGNLGGTVGSNLFPEGHAPNYWMGYSICLGVTAAAIASTLVLKGVYERMNGERRVEGGDGEESEDQEFRYVL
ncbi:major facilitator superfamily domain-containing protein [Aspergillus keveii]|uniref:Major facilitator superfamily domain-containing protein n=1 Tax=Aspergillus keveii TaxID=714993 RepID=A0ABR4FRS8_9EURO